MENKETTIYIVIGTTGEYSDKNEWFVIAYDKEESAKQHVNLATQEAHRILHLANVQQKHWFNFARIYDPNAECLDSSIMYYYDSLKLVTNGE